MLAVFSLTDMVYQLKASKALGMASMVEIHSPRELEEALSGPLDGSFDALVLVDRDATQLKIPPRSLEETLATFQPSNELIASCGVPVLLQVAPDSDVQGVALPDGITGLVL